MARPVLAALAPRELELGLELGASHVLRHWRYGHDARGVAWLLFDRMGAPVNTVDDEVLAELAEVLRRVVADGPPAVAIRSAKPAGFCAGVDVARLFGRDDAGEIEAALHDGHRLLDAIAALPMPTVAVLHGPSLGPGLELALSCRHRIAVEGAVLGFPESRLGLHPALGGIGRAAALARPSRVLALVATGGSLDAREALRLGLVDAVVPERHVAAAVRAAAVGALPARPADPRARLERWPPLREALARRLRRRLDPRHPAACVPIDLWARHADRPGALRAEETRSFVELLGGRTARNLARVSLLREALRGRGDAPGRVRHVHVIGAGELGGDLALWCVGRGLRVTLTDADPAALGAAVRRAAEQSPGESPLDRLIPDPRGYGLARADLVIEAVPDESAPKASALAEAEARMRSSALLVTTASRLSLAELAVDLRNPGRLVGLNVPGRFDQSEVIEVVAHEDIQDVAFSRAQAFVRGIGKLPLPVADGPGFLISRVLMASLAEAVAMLDEGAGPATVDRAATAFGMAVGPLEWADRIGLDACLSVAERLAVPAPLLDRLRAKLAQGHRGARSGRGFYLWRGGRPWQWPARTPPIDAADRLILPLLDACVAALRQGVVADEDTLDAGLVLGGGFPAATGGPLHHARAEGVPGIVRKLVELSRRHGTHLEPDEGWARMLQPGT
jgi:3-hydroxyacyl-CoA dehydrogenase/enoyl-CoA hydratase/3-hydroxybutyryl-CoA epimerase